MRLKFLDTLMSFMCGAAAIYTLIFLLFMQGCGSYPIEDYHPTLLDFKNGKGHVYNTERIKPKPQCGVRSYKFVYAQSIPLSSMAGYYCFKNEEVTQALRDFDEAEREDCERKLQESKTHSLQTGPSHP